MITFTVHGEPVGWQRVATNRSGARYMPNATRAYQTSIAWAAKAAGVRVIDGPVKIVLVVYHPIPASLRGQARRDAADNITRPYSKPDIDNVFKSVADALNGIAYPDDKNVVEVVISKLYGEPSIQVTVGPA